MEYGYNIKSIFIERAKDGSYIEAVEIDTSNNEVSRWGKSSITDDGI